MSTIKKLEDIGFYTLTDARCKNASKNSPIWRAEILLTGRCNFRCPYCKPLLEGCKEDLELSTLKTILQNLVKQKVKNIRFSGGEPTLYKQLLDVIKYCKDNNVERIALSTNGSAELNYYENLVKEGVNDFSISLDACCSQTGALMCGREKEQWKKIVKNIKELSKITYTTVGIVFNEENVSEVKEIILFAKNLGVSDIRIIPSAQYKKEDIISKLDFSLGQKYPILNYRIKNYNDGKRIRGLTEKDTKSCPLVLDDLVIAGNYHFPCIIYLRERGTPIGTLNDFDSLREQRYEWFLKHNCYQDKICRENCLDVCKAYNEKWEIFNQNARA